jgi:uncharacterized transporter YbjL
VTWLFDLFRSSSAAGSVLVLALTKRSPETTQCYATVYPLTMVLRMIAAQLIVLLFMR